MSRSRLLTDGFDARTDRRSAHPYATDAQFRDTAPLDTVTEAIRRPGLPLAALVATAGRRCGRRGTGGIQRSDGTGKAQRPSRGRPLPGAHA